ncbi:pentatricopeptide repeat-containing protein At2g30100, chloroplastic-like [Chenopodium quinoa]|uniref:Pentatricopeptide repeat-containing protein n=1 Tax=Chenopodium quinoa TaxID=63459 RepID=A0A803MW81_CHEQI|nr:pentatricopeptide repeat-containing protein At2g30100, chloroplastic-like [Chenopodium quinoa]
MVNAIGFAPLSYGIESSYPRWQDLVAFKKLRIEACSRVSITQTSDKKLKYIVPILSKAREFRLFNSVELDRVLTSVDEDEMSEGFFEAIEELERMAREPSDVLEEMNDQLSARELQLMLVYFSQEGRDSWCALEVFEWLKKENRVDKEMMELMVSIMCGWIKNMIEAEKEVGEVVDLLVDMDCVGLKPNFSMMEKAISVYWDSGKSDHAVSFVEEVLRRRIMSLEDGVDDIHRGGPAGYLAWKMMEKGDYRDAVRLVIRLRESELNPEMYSYLIAMTAVVKELNEVAKALRKLKGFSKAGLVAELDKESIRLVEKHQSDLLDEGILLSSWLIKEGNTSVLSSVHEKLLAMYICAGRGLDAEKQLWEMKLLGKEVERYFYDIVLAICAFQREDGAVSRLLTTLEATSSSSKKKTLSWLLRGYIKGGNYVDAAETLAKMLDSGLHPDLLDQIAVLQGLRKKMHQPGTAEIYLRLCKRLSDANLIGPCLVYMYIKKYKLWIVKMI